jgi:hypothetical protein
MNGIVRIDDEVIGVGEFIRVLKLTGQFEGLIEQLVRDKLTVHVGARQGMTRNARKKSRNAPTSSAACAACTAPPT